MLHVTDCVAGRARIIVMLHPEDEEGAAQRQVAAMTGIEALGGGAKVSQTPLSLMQRLHVLNWQVASIMFMRSGS